MNKETKLRIHNITAKGALKFGSDAWVLKKREEQILESVQQAEGCYTDTTPTQPHRNFNTHRNKNTRTMW